MASDLPEGDLNLNQSCFPVSLYSCKRGMTFLHCRKIGILVEKHLNVNFGYTIIAT